MDLHLVFVWIAVLAVASALLAALLWMRSRARHAADREDLDEAFLFSPERYRPMGALLSGEDEDVLASLPGYRPEIGVRFRRDRRRIFRMYLRDLRRDFHLLHAQARGLAAHAGADSSALIGMLVRQQVTFWWANAMLESRVALHAFGASPVDVRALVDSVERMRIDLTRFETAQST